MQGEFVFIGFFLYSSLHLSEFNVFLFGGRELGFEIGNASNGSGDYKKYLELGRFIVL